MAVFTGAGTAHGCIMTKTKWSFTEKGVDWGAFLSFWALICNGSLLTILGLNRSGGRLQLNSNQNDVTAYQWYANRMLTKLIIFNPYQPVQPYISSLSTKTTYLQRTKLAFTSENHNTLQCLLCTIAGRRCSGRCARKQCGIWARSHIKAAKQKITQKITF